MGLADDLAAFASSGYGAGLGQGLAAGAQNYTHGLAQQAEEERARKQFLMQQQQHDFDQAFKRNSLIKADMQSALIANNPEAAAGFVGDLNTSRRGLGLAALPTVVGSPMGGTPARTLYPQGPGLGGDPLPPMGLAAVAPHNDFKANPKTFDTLAGYADYVPPKPEITAFGPDQTIVRKNRDGSITQLGVTAAKAQPFTLGAEQIRYDANGNPVARGPAKSFAPGRAKTKLVQQPDGSWVEVAAGARTAPPSTKPADAKQGALLLQNAQTLAGRYGGQITSSGNRPVGSPKDTGKTLVNGHQTQWGLWNEYQAGRGALAAYPGTSEHGNGNAVDVFIPAPAREAFEREAANLGLNILSEAHPGGGTHYHLTAGGPLVAPKAAPHAGMRQDPRTGQWFVPRAGEVTNLKPKSGILGALEGGGHDDAVGQAIADALKNKGK